jgi:hypothetical protein
MAQVLCDGRLCPGSADSLSAVSPTGSRLGRAWPGARESQPVRQIGAGPNALRPAKRRRSADFPVPCSGRVAGQKNLAACPITHTGLESPVNPQVRKPALRLRGALRLRRPQAVAAAGVIRPLRIAEIGRATAGERVRLNRLPVHQIGAGPNALRPAKRRRSADFPVCGFAELSSSVFRARGWTKKLGCLPHHPHRTGKSGEPAG